MQEIFRFVEEPRRCSYLPWEAASLEVRLIEQLSPVEYAGLLERGYRRFGRQVFRPGCHPCRQCRSIRVLLKDFSPSASQRRILRQNQAARVEFHPPFVTNEHVGLYNRYQHFMSRHRGWPDDHVTAGSYHEAFLSGKCGTGGQWMAFEGGRLVGVSLMDTVPGAVSLVYSYYDPEWRAQSPGTFLILAQLSAAKEWGALHAYLGYWIEDCQSMRYKNRFRPHEILREYPPDGESPVWERPALPR